MGRRFGIFQPSTQWRSAWSERVRDKSLEKQRSAARVRASRQTQLTRKYCQSQHSRPSRVIAQNGDVGDPPLIEAVERLFQLRRSKVRTHEGAEHARCNHSEHRHIIDVFYSPAGASPPRNDPYVPINHMSMPCPQECNPMRLVCADHKGLVLR